MTDFIVSESPGGARIITKRKRKFGMGRNGRENLGEVSSTRGGGGGKKRVMVYCTMNKNLGTAYAV